MHRPPSGGQQQPRLPSTSTFTGLVSMPHIPRPPPAAHFGLIPGYPTPTTGQISYPMMYSKPTDHHYRQAEVEILRREVDHHKKRPSLLSDFHFTQSNMAVAPMSSSSTDKGASTSHVKELMSKHELAARRSLQLDVPTYAPQVENISPTPDEQNDYSSQDKGEILITISKVDREINVVDEKVKKLLKKKAELEEVTLPGSDDDANSPSASVNGANLETKSQSLFEKIYAENRKKAASTHSKLVHLDPPAGITPVYQQPWDTKLFEDLRKKHEEFRPRFILHLKRMHRTQQIREKYLTQRYNQQMQEWKKKMERFERHPKRIAKEQRNREIFEKTFPELKKQREERERSMRSDGRSTMLGQGDVSYDTVCVQEEEEVMKMRQNAVLPPMMYDERTRKRMRYINNNNLVRDPIGEHKFRLDFFKINWTDEERRTFRGKFLQYGKNFAAIAAFLDKKTTKDCVQFYYLTKKRENYKQMMRRPYRRRGKPYKPPQMPRVDDGSKEYGDGNDPEASMSAVSEDVAPGETEYFCIDCKCKIDVNNPGRVLTRSCYEQYGLDPTDPAAQEVRICLKCRLGSVRKRCSQCPVGACNSVKRRVKPRVFPAKWFEVSIEQRKIIAAEFQMAEDTNRCCGSCYKRLHRRLETMVGLVGDASSTDSSSTKQEMWRDEDVNRLKEAVLTFGTNNWDVVASHLTGKTSEECKQFHCSLEKSSSNESKRAKVGQVPGIEEEEEEDDGGNSDDDENVPPSRVPSPKVENISFKPEAEKREPVSSPMVESVLVIDEETTERKRKITMDSQAADDESSATLSADEGQNETEPIEEKKFMKVERLQSPKDIASQRSSAVAPENLPACIIPYKPKSRQIHRVEEENRIAAAMAAAAAVPQLAAKPNLLQHVQPLSSIIGLSTVSKNLQQQPSAGSTPAVPVCQPTENAFSRPPTIPAEQNPNEIRDSESPMVVKVISRTTKPADTMAHSPLPTVLERIGVVQSNSGQQQEVMRGSLTKGTPVLPPTYIVGGDSSGQQKMLDMSKMFRPPPSKSEETGRAASADTLKDARFATTDPSRYTPSGMGREQQQQINSPAHFPGQRGVRMTYDQQLNQLNLLRQQQMLQQAAKQSFDQQAAVLFSQALNSLPQTAQAQFLNEFRTAAMQMPKQTGGHSQAELLAAQHMEATQNAIIQSQRAAAFEQQQHYLAEQQRHLEQQCLAADIQKRVLQSLSESQRRAEMEKIRLFEQHYQQLQQQQQGEAIRTAEFAIRQQQQQQQQGDAIRTAEFAMRQQQQQVATERAVREREMIAEYHRTPHTPTEQHKILEGQQRPNRSPSTATPSRQQTSTPVVNTLSLAQQQQLLDAMMQPHQHMNLTTKQQQIAASHQQVAASPQQQMTKSQLQQQQLTQQQQQQQLMQQQQQQQQQLTPEQQQQIRHLQQQQIAQAHIQMQLQQQQIAQAQLQQQQQKMSQGQIAHQQMPAARSQQQRSSPAVSQQQSNIKSDSKVITTQQKASDMKPVDILRGYSSANVQPPVTRQSIIQHGASKTFTAKKELQLSEACAASSRSTGSGTRSEIKRSEPPPTKAAMKEFPPCIKESHGHHRQMYLEDPAAFLSAHAVVSAPSMSLLSSAVTQPSRTGPFVSPLATPLPAVVSTITPMTSSYPSIPSLTSVATGPPFIPTPILTVAPVAVVGPPISTLSRSSPAAGSSSVLNQTTSVLPLPSSTQQQTNFMTSYQPLSSSSSVPSMVGTSSPQVQGQKETVSHITASSARLPVAPVQIDSAVKPIVSVPVSSVAASDRLATPVVTLIESMITKHHAEESIIESKSKPAESVSLSASAVPVSSSISAIPVSTSASVERPLARPEHLSLRETVQKLEKMTTSLNEVSPKPDPVTAKLVPSPKTSVSMNPKGVGSSHGTSNIIKHIDDVIIGEIQTAKGRDAPPPAPPPLPIAVAPPPPPPPPPVSIVPPPVSEPQLEPVTPDSAPSSSITTFAFDLADKLQGAKHFGMKQQMSSSFEYDLEPVSPPEAEESYKPVQEPPVSEPPKSAPSSSWRVSTQEISPDLPIAQTMTPSSVPPFMAFNVFTLPNVSTASSSAAPWPQTITSGSSSQTAEDNESTRAVAALIENEFQNEPNSNMPMYKIDEPIVSSSSNTIVNLPTYEPLSDDES